jgi:type II secretory pathway pseudopilin PulG
MRTQRAFTLFELLIILVIIAILVTIALPNLLGSKIDTNETAQNRNGAGEYGTYGEMSGNVAVRAGNGGAKYLTPSTINPSFRAISPIGEMYRNGYYYRIYLPGAAGEGLIELPGGGADPAIDPDRAEAIWCVYAWPQKYGVTGRRTFFVNQQGDITFTEDESYAGPGAPIPAGAAFEVGGPAGNIDGTSAVGVNGRDGNLWRVSGK